MPDLSWTNLGFNPVETNSIIVSRFKDGVWSEPQSVNSVEFSINFFAGSLHYASSCFEGLKAFRGADGKVRIFRPEENADRMTRSADFLAMPSPSKAMFLEMVARAVKENIEFLPPYGFNASMYIRPLIFGSSPQLGVATPAEVTFAVMVSPVGAYVGKTLVPVSAVLVRNYDRAAPNGSGSYKISANYAPSLRPYKIAHEQGFGEILFLDSSTHSCIDEFGSSNFIGIKDGVYVTPLSSSILPSITNKSLRTIAEDLGIKVERRPVSVEELQDFQEVGACGTAVVITPIHSITDKPALESEELTRTYSFGEKDKCGHVLHRMYDVIRGIQDGTEEDIHNWCMIL
ncbi:MAG: branched-chain amino acid aminotransferase [Bacteroidales bacterium]|nr:branched-chain amino acid aminotransferase [Candidatus Cryptobacteroides equifaecalis]